jgi:L-amino acid N-acyltransferase YncA
MNSNIALTLRVANLSDLSTIVEIYNQAVASQKSTARIEPVTLDERRSWFLEHDPHKYPIFVAEHEGQVIGWCSLSIYRPGRVALRFTAEISYYIDKKYQRQGVGKTLVSHVIVQSPSFGIKNIVAVLIDRNDASRKLVEKLGFQQWGYLPRVLDFDGVECGEFYFGKRVAD